MINSVSFRNFRGLNELTMPLSQVTMLTGTNGAGKTSVLEGVYCLLSETRLDVSPLSRYNKSIGIVVNQAANIPVGFAARQSYNYRLFWEECPAYEQSECSVEAKSDNGLSWSWKYQKANLSDLRMALVQNSPVPIDSSTEFALWNWQIQGNILDKKTHKINKVNEKFDRAQILAPDGGMYLLPLEMKAISICKYLDFASMRLQPRKLPFHMSKQLTKALQIINPRVTDVRLTDIESGLSVVLDDNNSVALGTLGNGAVAWTSALIAIFDVVETVKNQPWIDIPIVLLIDEMGAGVHYSVMLDVWKYINEFTKQNRNIQFVFTSHSDDCIRAYCEAFSESDMARIVRLHQTARDNKVIQTDYQKDSFKSIVDGDWEVRG